jgi:hypothetical protein
MVTSNVVTLTVNPTPQAAPSITSQPVSVIVTAPATATFTVAANGYPAPTFQWMQSVNGGAFTNISGATSASYTTPATTAANSGTQLECVVKNASGTVTSNVVSLTVNSTPTAPVTGLVGWWQFAEEPSGTACTGATSTVTDSSGNNNTGTCVNSPSWTTGQASGAMSMSFNGLQTASGPYITIPNSASLNGMTGLSVCAWVNPSSIYATDGNSIVTKSTHAVGGQSAPYGLYGLSTTPGGAYSFQLGNGSTSQTVNSASLLALGQYQHVCGTWDGTTMRLYKNGVADANTQGASYAAIGTNSIDLRIGAYRGSSPYYDTFNGAIGDVRIYNRALSPSEVSQLYNAGLAPSSYSITATAGSGGSILPSGAVTVSAGASQTFTVTPDAGYNINQVLVDNNPVTLTSGNTYTLNNVTAAHTINASFTAMPVYSITTSVGGGNGTITANPASVVQGGSSTLTITPSTGYNLSSLTVNGTTVPVSSLTAAGSGYTYVLSGITSVQTAVAVFSPMTYTITATAGSNGSISPSGVTTVNYNGSQVYTITPNTGYQIASILINGTALTGTLPTSYTFSNVTANATISVTFTPITFTITATAGSNGSISPSGVTTVSYNGSQVYTITPNTGYQIASILINGTALTGTLPTSYTFSNVTANATISVTFTPIIFSITATAGSNGSITPSGNVSVIYGTSQTFTVTPNTGYIINQVLVDGNVVTLTAGNTYTLNNVTAVHSISATFSAASSTQPTGLVGWWQFAEQPSGTACSGTTSTVTDSSGNNNTGTCVNSPSWTAGQAGGTTAMSFNGAQQSSSNPYITIPNSASLNGMTGLSVCAWVNPSSIYAIDGNSIVSKSTHAVGGQSAPYGLYGLSTTQSGGYSFQLGNGSTSQTVNSASLLALGQYQHVCGTWDGTTMRLYKNGVADANTQSANYAAIGTNSIDLRIGAYRGSSPYYDTFNGAIGDVRIYNRALSASEVATIYNAGLNPIPAAPVITTQPSNVTVAAPSTATFTVAATGSPAPTYQWMQSINGGAFTIINGATGASYTTPATTTANSGTQYECVVTNTSGSMTSNAASLTVNPAPPTPVNGLVGWWQFAEQPSGTACSGTTSTVTDSSGNNNTGTCVNSPSWTAGQAGGTAAMSFNGAQQSSNPYITIPNSASLNGMTGLSVCAWVNPSSIYATDGNTIVSKSTHAVGGQASPYNLYALETMPNGTYGFELGDGTTRQQLSSASALALGQYQHVCGTWDGTTMRLYKNGVADANTKGASYAAIGTNSIDLRIGAYRGSSPYYDTFNGAIGDVRIYNRALSASEVATIYNAGKGN